MKRILFILAAICLIVPAGAFAYTMEKPMCTQDDAWQAVVDNAYEIAEEYADANNPRSTFMTSIENFTFVKETGGSYAGKYLLTITTEHGKDYSVAVLLPLFDVDQPSYNLDVDKPLWKIIRAELNGKAY